MRLYYDPLSLSDAATHVALAAALTTTVVTIPATAAATATHNEVIHTTTNHPGLTADHGWLAAGFLHFGEPAVRG